MSAGLARFQQSGETGAALSPLAGFCCLSRERWGWDCGGEAVSGTHHGGVGALLGWFGLGVRGFIGREELQNVVQSKHLLRAGCAMVQGSHPWF